MKSNLTTTTIGLLKWWVQVSFLATKTVRASATEHNSKFTGGQGIHFHSSFSHFCMYNMGELRYLVVFVWVMKLLCFLSFILCVLGLNIWRFLAFLANLSVKYFLLSHLFFKLVLGSYKGHLGVLPRQCFYRRDNHKIILVDRHCNWGGLSPAIPCTDSCHFRSGELEESWQRTRLWL